MSAKPRARHIVKGPMPLSYGLSAQVKGSYWRCETRFSRLNVSIAIMTTARSQMLTKWHCAEAVLEEWLAPQGSARIDHTGCVGARSGPGTRLVR
jgi:hypothetical protein